MKVILRKILGLLILAVAFSSCSAYSKLVKSNDYQLKLMWADQYYAKGEYARASTLYQDVAPFYRGTEEMERISHTLSDCAVKTKEYETAIHYYTQYIKTYPRGKYLEESYYMIGYCYYRMSPEAKMEQSSTFKALEAFALYLELYPNSDKVQEISLISNELYDKLAYKEYLNVKLYYNLGDYMGNNYRAAVITGENALESYPHSKYKEDISFIILKSKFKEAQMSVSQKMLDRFVGVIDEYYNFIGEYPQSKNKKEAEKIFNIASKYVQPNLEKE